MMDEWSVEVIRAVPKYYWALPYIFLKYLLTKDLWLPIAITSESPSPRQSVNSKSRLICASFGTLLQKCSFGILQYKTNLHKHCAFSLFFNDLQDFDFFFNGLLWFYFETLIMHTLNTYSFFLFLLFYITLKYITKSKLV